MKVLTRAIVVVLILLLAWGALGYGYYLGKQAAMKEVPSEVQVSKTALEERTGELEKSQVVDSFCANLMGEMIEVSKDTLTLSRGEDLLKIEVGEDTRFYRRETPKPGEVPSRKEIKFEEINKGDQGYVYARLTKEGKLIAYSITVSAPQ